MPAIPAAPARDEAKRLAALLELGVLDTLPEQAFDDIVAIAAQICGTPIGLVSLVDAQRQWFKAKVGLGVDETHRDLAFCAHAIVAAEPVFVVEDALQDPRFADSALVTGAPHIRFYAGAPIVLPGGQALGTVCVIDTVPRRLDAAQLGALQALARQAAALFELRQRTRASQQQAIELKQLSEQAAAERRHSAELLEIVLRGGNLGLWDLHVPSGAFTINEREHAMLGYSAQDARPEVLAWHTLVHPDDWPMLNAAMAPHLRGETAYWECEHRMRHKDGHTIWVLDRAVVVERDATGAALRMVGTHMDITERRCAGDALERATDLLQRMGTLAKVGGWELELASGEITWTDEVYRIHEVDRSTELALLANIEFYAPQARPLLQAAVASAIEHGTPYDLELPFITARGRALTVRTQGEAVMRDGKAVRLFGTFQDITERKRTEAALQVSEERLSLALSSSRVAVFDWDITTDRVYRSANFSVMRGGPADEGTSTIAEVQALIHPADLLTVRTTIQAALRGELPAYEFEHRIRRFDGAWIWVHAVGRVTERGADGRALRISGTDEDVTERKAAAQALLDSQRRLRLITDNLPALVAYIDRDERYRFLNAHVGTVFRIDPQATLGRTMREVRGEATYAALAPHVAQALRGEASIFSYADQIGGRSYRYQSNYVPDVDGAGAVQGFYAMTFDITELHETQRQLERLARVDALTGLPNRRQVDDRIKEAMARTRRTRRPMAVMFLDIDHFKAINDALGHAGGDAVLCEFARRLKACVRTTDMVARFAGDEFVVLLEGVEGAAELDRLAAKVVACIRPRFQVGAAALDVTTSVGVTLYGGAEQTAAEVLSRADGALYQAKKQGRNRHAVA
ncbi:MAG: diguanylate cyclase [Burkholderiales bacterium]|nr:diguanylate cyclase [Burkholderiales bacterium]